MCRNNREYREDRVRNEHLYQMIKVKPWSETIQERRLRLLGHILRLPDKTPVRKALEEYHRPVQRDPGRPLMTWWTLIKNDLKTLEITEDASIENLKNLTSGYLK